MIGTFSFSTHSSPTQSATVATPQTAASHPPPAARSADVPGLAASSAAGRGQGGTMREQLVASSSAHAPKRRRLLATGQTTAATAPAFPSRVLEFASPALARQTAHLAHLSGGADHDIQAWLAGMCLDAAGRPETAETAACKQLIVVSCLNALLTMPGGLAKFSSIFTRDSSREQVSIVQQLLAQFPVEKQWKISARNWKKIHKKSNAFNLLALAAPQLDWKHSAYTPAQIIQCAKTATCRDMVALCDPGADRLHIPGAYRGKKSEAAVTGYLDALAGERATLAAAGYTVRQMDDVLAPVTLSKDELTRITKLSGGANRLAIAAAELRPLLEQRVAFCMNGWFQAAMDAPPGRLTKDQLIAMLSTSGGANSLAAVKGYQGLLREWRKRLQELAYTAKQIKQVLAPLTLETQQLVHLVAHNGGARSLAVWSKHMTPLVEARLSLCEQGQVLAALDQEPGALTKDQMLRILAVSGGGKNLEAALAYHASMSVPRAIMQPTAGAPHELAQVLAPVTLSTEELLRIVSPCGGATNLEAATAYLKPLFDCRMELWMQGQVQATVTMPHGALSKVQLVAILSHAGGAVNLAAALNYLNLVAGKRVDLEFAGYTPDQIKQVLAPVTLNADEVVKLSRLAGGVGRLTAAINCLKPLLEQRLARCMEKKFEDALQEPLGAFTKGQLTIILALNRGEKRLAIAQRYQEAWQARCAGMLALAPARQIEQVLAPVTLNSDELVAIASHRGGLKRLETGIAYLQPLLEQRLALCEQGQFQAPLAQRAGVLSKEELVGILSKIKGAEVLAERLASSGRAVSQPMLPMQDAAQDILMAGVPEPFPLAQPSDQRELADDFTVFDGALLNALMPGFNAFHPE